MSIEQIKHLLLDSAKDIKLNLSTVLMEDDSDLHKNQIGGIALASAYATKNRKLIDNILSVVRIYLSDEEINAAESAATIMAMNNIYYRFIHLTSDKSYATMPAKLRMNIIGNPGIDKIDFELSCLAVSAINGCGLCIDSHVQALIKAGASKLAIQSSIRIASVLNAAAMGIEIAS